MKQLISLILCVLMCLPVLASCNFGKKETETTYTEYFSAGLLPASSASRPSAERVDVPKVEDTSTDAALSLQSFTHSILKVCGYALGTDMTVWMRKAYELEILKLEDLALLDKPISKSKAAQLLVRAAREPETFFPENYYDYSSNIKDFEKVPDNLKDSVVRSCVLGIVFENENGEFNPETTVSKDELTDYMTKLSDKKLRRDVRSPKSVEVKKDYVWAKDDCDPIEWMGSPIWNVGSPQFSNDTENKKEGVSALRCDYNASKGAYYLASMSPYHDEPLDFSDIDYMEFDFYNAYNYERNLQFMFQDSYGKKYYLRSNFEYVWNFYGTKDMTKGPAWMKVRFYFDQINSYSAHMPAPDREGLKDIASIMIVFKDDDGQNKDMKEGYFLIDDIRFYKYEKTDTTPKINRMPEKFESTDPRLNLLTQVNSDAKQLEEQGKKLEAAVKYSQALELSSNIKPAAEKIVEIYKGLNSEERVSLKDTLYNKYYYWANDDLTKAKGLQGVYQQLVDIEASYPEMFSYGLSCNTIGPAYNFTSEDRLTETAKILRNDIQTNSIKFALSYDHIASLKIDIPAGDKSLARLASLSGYKNTLDMDFETYVFWIYSSKGSDWYSQGLYNKAMADKEYQDIYDLTKYLLETYNDTGKSFYMGNWEGDWHLTTFDQNEPALSVVYGMHEWFSMRYKAIEDARRDVKHSNVNVYSYLEVNMVVGIPTSNGPRLVNTVLPYVKSDYTSWSSYNCTGDFPNKAGLADQYYKSGYNYIKSYAPPSDIAGEKIIIGEFGFPDINNTPQQAVEFTNEDMYISFELGVPLLLYWELYCNEYNEVENRYNGFWIIDNNNVKQPIYFYMQEFNAQARTWVTAYKATHDGKNPSTKEYQEFAKTLLLPRKTS